jgi:hypothetical protein|tara:strand:- start:178 stop:387 length:210 start_codon:yes stop_codon:yes gene_type:complete
MDIEDLKEAGKMVTDPIKKKIGNIWGGIKATPSFVFKKKSQEVDDDGYEEGKSKEREIDIPDPYIPPQP